MVLIFSGGFVYSPLCGGVLPEAIGSRSLALFTTQYLCYIYSRSNSAVQIKLVMRPKYDRYPHKNNSIVFTIQSTANKPNSTSVVSLLNLLAS